MTVRRVDGKRLKEALDEPITDSDIRSWSEAMLHGIGASASHNLGRRQVTSNVAPHGAGDGHAHNIQAGPRPTTPSTQSQKTEADKTSDGRETAPEQRGNLSESEQQQVAELKTRDRQVRAHEMAHKAAAGSYGGPVSYEYQEGPDGQRYAVGGEVSIDASAVAGNPEATIQKMQVIARAALAPAQPSAQDRSVAMHAQQTSANARRELLAEKMQADGSEINAGKEDQDVNQVSDTYGSVTSVGESIDKTA